MDGTTTSPSRRAPVAQTTRAVFGFLRDAPRIIIIIWTRNELLYFVGVYTRLCNKNVYYINFSTSVCVASRFCAIC